MKPTQEIAVIPVQRGAIQVSEKQLSKEDAELLIKSIEEVEREESTTPTTSAPEASSTAAPDSNNKDAAV